MSELDNILTALENTVALDTIQRMSANGGKISPKHHHAQKKQQIKNLMEDLAIDHVTDDGDLRRIQEAIEKL